MVGESADKRVFLSSGNEMLEDGELASRVRSRAGETSGYVGGYSTWSIRMAMSVIVSKSPKGGEVRRV